MKFLPGDYIVCEGIEGTSFIQPKLLGFVINIDREFCYAAGGHCMKILWNNGALFSVYSNWNIRLVSRLE